MPHGDAWNTDWNRRTKVRRRFERMGLPCGICGKPIDYSLGMIERNGKMVPHPDRFEVDHIDDRQDGGDMWDMGNMQPAHRRCNLEKQARRKHREAVERKSGGRIVKQMDDGVTGDW